MLKVNNTYRYEELITYIFKVFSKIAFSKIAEDHYDNIIIDIINLNNSVI